MRAVVGTLAALVALEATTTIAGGQMRNAVHRRETVSHTLRFAGGGERHLEISTVNGSIRLVGHDDDAVEVVVTKTVRGETEADVAAGDAAVGWTMEEEVGAIRLRGHPEAQPGCDRDHGDRERERGRPRYQVAFDFEVRAPRTARLRLCTVNGGDVHVAAIAGPFEIDNVNGAITLTAMRGAGRAATVNGHVTAAFVEAPAAPLVLKSVNGDLDVELPRSLSADLLLKTFNGGLFTDFDVAPLAPPPPVVERRRGMNVYRTNRFNGFRVGGGGPELTFETFNGDVRVVASRQSAVASRQASVVSR